MTWVLHKWLDIFLLCRTSFVSWLQFHLCCGVFQNSILSLYWIIRENIHSYLICSLVGRHLVFLSSDYCKWLLWQQRWASSCLSPCVQCLGRYVLGRRITESSGEHTLYCAAAILFPTMTGTTLYSHQQWCGGLIPTHAAVFTLCCLALLIPFSLCVFQ